MRFVIIEKERRTREKIERIVKDACPGAVLVGTSENGKAGWELICEGQPELVIMDLLLTGMTGLSLLKKMRAEKIGARVIIITSDTDFNHARQAIELSVDNYILKPVKTSQLKHAVLQARDKSDEQKILEKTFTLENIFTGCLNGQLYPDGHFNQMAKEKFGFTLEEPGALFSVWLGNGYTKQRDQVREILEKAGTGEDFCVCPVAIDTWHLMAAVIYRTGGNRSQERQTTGGFFEYEYSVFKDHVVPSLSGSVSGEMICLWEGAECLSDLPEALRRMRRIREWNLLFERGELIRREDVDKLEVIPLKYPVELEGQMRQAVLSANGEEMKKCYYRLYDIFRRETHSPRDMKECLIRFNMSVLSAYKMGHEIKSELEIQYSMQSIADAVSWSGIREAMEKFTGVLEFQAFEDENDSSLSPLIKKAVQMVRKYYDQGITLEEMAERLFVSEEYLSVQFKKETGKGFTETVRSLRIERIKGLLLSTRLKLNQIAELTGYTDPKYMSRVFKEEVGMLPTEFRKLSH